MELILIVDDEPQIREVYSRGLERWAARRGYRLRTAPDASAALAILEVEHHETALILSDMRMPGLSGTELLLRVHELYPDIATMVVSGYEDLSSIRAAIGAGISAYLLKPCEMGFLQDEMERALATRALRRENQGHLQRLREELDWAGALQRQILQPQIPEDTRVRFQVTSLTDPRIGCGGDYADLIRLTSSKWLLLVADVSGHGLRPAFVTVMLKALVTGGYLAHHTREQVTPRDLLDWLGHRLYTDLSRAPGLIVSVAAVMLDFDARVLTCSNAGHPAPIHVRSGTARPLAVSGMALGVEDGTRHDSITEDLAPGDAVVLYTDGLVEAAPGRAGIDAPTLARLLVEHMGEGAPNDGLLAAVRAHTGQQDFADDVTILTAVLT